MAKTRVETALPYYEARAAMRMQVLLTTDAERPRWLDKLGFQFDPFKHLESSTDHHLNDYLVGHELCEMAWDESPALVFGPAGGGKTATRIYAARSCWIPRGGAHSFPIPYIIDTLDRSSPTDQLQRIVEDGATALLIGLLHRPSLLLVLRPEEQQAVVSFLESVLPGQLERCLDQLRSGESPQSIGSKLIPSYQIPAAQASMDTKSFDRVVTRALERATPQAEAVSFEGLLSILLNTLRFQDVHVQIDGVDATAETIHSTRAMAQTIRWILEQAPAWQQQRVLVKCFFPSELEQELRTTHTDLSTFKVGHLYWTPDLLATIIRERVYQATGGNLERLDAGSSRALRNVDVEARLAEIALPLPREIIYLTRHLLEAYDERTGVAGGLIEPVDIDEAERRYELHKVDPGPIFSED